LPYGGDGIDHSLNDELGIGKLGIERGQKMNQIDERQIGQHVMIVGWLHIVGSALFLGIAALVFFLLTGIGVASGDAQAVTVLGIVGTSVAAFLSLLALPGIAAGIGLVMHKSWGRVLGIVVGILNLINFPIGTLIGAYTLWVLFQDSATDYFATEQVELRPHEGQPTA
jgi:hypothetical protein